MKITELEQMITLYERKNKNLSLKFQKSEKSGRLASTLSHLQQQLMTLKESVEHHEQHDPTHMKKIY